MRHHYRIVNPVRFFFFILLSVMIIIFAGYGLLNIGSAEAASAETYTQVVISENDTLWEIADHYNPDGDIRSIVHEIYEINGITASDVVPGLTISVPIY